MHLSTTVDEKASSGGKERLGVQECLVKMHEDEYSLTSSSTAPTDSELSSEPASDEIRDEIRDEVRDEEPKQQIEKPTSGEEAKAPSLADLSYAEEEEETRPGIPKQLSTVDDDDDDLSQASATTLLSDLSSVDEQPELDRLEDDFQLRDKLMKTFVVEKDPERVRIVTEYEEAMRKALREHHELKAIQESNRRSRKKRSTAMKSTVLDRIGQTLLLNETALGFASVVLYCIAHLSCWEITTAFLYELTQNYENQCAVHFVFLVTSLIMLRMSGGIFGWLDTETYGEAQLGLQRRHGSVDTRIIKWFRRHPNLKATINMLAFYICWTAVAFFQNCGLRLLDKRDDVARGLPSYHREDVITSVKEKLVYGLTYDEEVLEMEAQDYAHLVKEVSVSSLSLLMGDETVALVSTTAAFLFFAVAAIVSIAVLRFKLGHTFEI